MSFFYPRSCLVIIKDAVLDLINALGGGPFYHLWMGMIYGCRLLPQVGKCLLMKI